MRSCRHSLARSCPNVTKWNMAPNVAISKRDWRQVITSNPWVRSKCMKGSHSLSLTLSFKNPNPVQQWFRTQFTSSQNDLSCWGSWLGDWHLWVTRALCEGLRTAPQHTVTPQPCFPLCPVSPPCSLRPGQGSGPRLHACPQVQSQYTARHLKTILGGHTFAARLFHKGKTIFFVMWPRQSKCSTEWGRHYFITALLRLRSEGIFPGSSSEQAHIYWPGHSTMDV